MLVHLYYTNLFLFLVFLVNLHFNLMFFEFSMMCAAYKVTIIFTTNNKPSGIISKPKSRIKNKISRTTRKSVENTVHEIYLMHVLSFCQAKIKNEKRKQQPMFAVR